MKRILIVNNNMYIGGVQKALVNLLHEIAGEYEITLVLFYPGGELLKEIPAQVKVLSASPVFRTLGMNRQDSKVHHLLAERAFYALLARLAGRKWMLQLQLPFQKKLGRYDVAISYLHNGNPHTFYGGCNEFVLNCVDADRKIAFLHCDYGQIHGDSPDNTVGYRQFDRIAACSAGCRDAFLDKIPQLKDRTAVVHNCHNFQQIQSKAALAPVSLPVGKLNVVIVARFGREKGIFRAIQAISLLGEDRNKICCHLIGQGVEFEKAQCAIQQLNLQDSVFLLGEMENPYGYMKAADLLLIPSYSEAAPMVIGEAACLGTPILSTLTSSACEMVEQAGYGWVCPNSCEGICQGLRQLLSDPERLVKCKKRLQNTFFSNAEAVREFKQIIQ